MLNGGLKSNTDDMTPDNSVGIDYRLVPLQRNYGSYKAGQVWAEPDIDQAAYWMKRLTSEPDLALSIGARAQQTIEENLLPRVIGDLIRQRLTEIRPLFS